MLCDLSIQSFWKRSDQLLQVGCLNHLVHQLIRNMVHTIGDVIPDRPGEQDRLLGYDSNMGTVALEV